MFRRPRRPEPDLIEVVIGPRATFHGSLRCDSSVRIDGVVEGGQIETLSNVILTESARVECDIIAKTVSIRGLFSGTVRADRAELLEGCRVSGSLFVNSFYIDDGAALNGQLHMQESALEAEPVVSPPQPQKPIPVVDPAARLS